MRLTTIQSLTLTGLIFLLPVNPASAEYNNRNHSDSNYIVDTTYDNDNRYVDDNPVPEEYQDEELIIVLALVTIGLLLGTGQSIKYLKKD